MTVVRELIAKIGFQTDKQSVSAAENAMASIKTGLGALAGAWLACRFR